MNGQVNGNTGTHTERVFRSHDRPNISAPELAAMQRGYLERLGTIVEELSTITRRPDVQTGVIDSPGSATARNECSRGIERSATLAHLVRRTLDGGAVGYSLPTNLLRSIVAKLTGANGIAFVHNGAGSRSASIEVRGKDECEIMAAMAFAANLWLNEDHRTRRRSGRSPGHRTCRRAQPQHCQPRPVYSVVGERRARANRSRCQGGRHPATSRRHRAGAGSMSNLVRRANSSARHDLDVDALAGPWSVLTSEPLTGVAVHARAGHLLIEMELISGSLRMQVTRSDLRWC